MEFDSPILYTGLALFSILAIFLAYRILFPPLCLHGMAVYEAQEYMNRKGKQLGVKIGFVQPTREKYNYLGTIASHSLNPVTNAEDYVLYQIDIPYVEPPKIVPPPFIPEVAYIPEPIDLPELEPISPIIEPFTPIPEPPIPEPTPIPVPVPKKTSRTTLNNPFNKGNYFWS